MIEVVFTVFLGHRERRQPFRWRGQTSRPLLLLLQLIVNLQPRQPGTSWGVFVHFWNFRNWVFLDFYSCAFLYLRGYSSRSLLLQLIDLQLLQISTLEHGLAKRKVLRLLSGNLIRWARLSWKCCCLRSICSSNALSGVSSYPAPFLRSGWWYISLAHAHISVRDSGACEGCCMPFSLGDQEVSTYFCRGAMYRRRGGLNARAAHKVQAAQGGQGGQAAPLGAQPQPQGGNLQGQQVGFNSSDHWHTTIWLANGHDQYLAYFCPGN